MEWYIPKVCAWCKQYICDVEVSRKPEKGDTTHGICDKCYKIQMAEVERRLAKGGNNVNKNVVVKYNGSGGDR